MSTLELADLLNQEVVENPLLEEVQTEDAQAADGAAPDKTEGEPERRPRPTAGTTGTTPISSGTTSTTATGRGPSRKSRNSRRSRTRCRRPRRWPITSSGSCRSRSTDDATREIGDAIIGNLDDDGYLVASVDEIARMGDWTGGPGRGHAPADAGVRPDRRGGARPPGVPLAAAAAPRPGGHARRADRHRAPAAARRTTRCPRSRRSSGCRSTT